MDLGSPYFVLLSIGFACGCWFFLRRGQKLGIERLALIDVCIAAVVGGMLGSRALHVAVEPLPDYALDAEEIGKLRARLPDLDPEGRAAVAAALAAPPVRAPWLFIARMPASPARSEAIALARTQPEAVPARLWYRAHPLDVIQFWKGGLAYLGGLALAVVLGVLVCWKHGVPVPRAADVAGPAITLGLVFGRLGCFLGGCCFGAVCEPAWWAAQPGWYDPPVGGVPRYPTALLSAGFALLLFLGLRWLLERRAFDGEVALAMLTLYAPGRFVIEAIRDDPRGGAGGLSTSQIAVLVSGIPAALVWIGLRLRPAPSPRPPPPDSPSTEPPS